MTSQTEPFASTPAPPYTAVIFTSLRATAHEADEYAETAHRMEQLAAEQPGYLGIESCRDPVSGLGITVSYWASDAAARAWKRVAEHRQAQHRGRSEWYRRYRVRVARVERDY
ncbi:MAG TPA: antibiotic biosynthesis monooxygenase [Jatrophihabitans sp.]|nr:antibiotic biosynthesis monooxygenase [Jatrophihabitans sp.]